MAFFAFSPLKLSTVTMSIESSLIPVTRLTVTREMFMLLGMAFNKNAVSPGRRGSSFPEDIEVADQR
ncbi:hypothetical protein HYALB_00001432 [Hymenoscyphus albidus]|uniref:Uncharacterized protein n=1 Tax=Hymenoscyphus albidus TaxID=595503 RepID=A0A9N9Q2Q0_9HELO|nr:hypothetical protein HYALB_00001432 [Hymenoscyphus albidus]